MGAGVTEETRELHLSEEDVERICDELERRLVRHFYTNLGRGLWGIIWKTLLWAALAVAAYGIAKGLKP